MSPENIPPPPENHSITKKTTIQKPPQPPLPPPQDPPQKCPRCDSSNTKFCYYNNYSLTQPRHFCKTCRRYWTRGGALRNVPVGGGCRKPAKSHRLKPPNKPGFIPIPGGMNPEFHLGGISPPRLHPATAGVYTQFVTGCGPGGGGGPYFGLDLFGPNYQTATTSSLVGGNENQNNQITISSIESLSSINQEMHWKLQAQRLGLFYGPSSQDDNNNNNNIDNEGNKKGDEEKLLFNNLEVGNNGDLHGVWGDLDLRQHNLENNQQQVHQFHGLQ